MVHKVTFVMDSDVTDRWGFITSDTQWVKWSFLWTGAREKGLCYCLFVCDNCGRVMSQSVPFCMQFPMSYIFEVRYVWLVRPSFPVYSLATVGNIFCTATQCTHNITEITVLKQCLPLYVHFTLDTLIYCNSTWFTSLVVTPLNRSYCILM